MERSDSLRSARGQNRNSWRNSNASIRSSTGSDYTNFLHPSSGSGSVRHSLRPAESRFSLHEQFAATRREYEFGFDDASSVWERGSTVASVAEGEEGDETVKFDFDLIPTGDEGVGGEAWAGRDYYDLLCLPRDGSATPERIREAYWRLFRLLDAEDAPGHVRVTARAYFGDVQRAFETLIEPGRREGYEGVVGDDGMSVGEEDEVQSAEADEGRYVPLALLRQLQYQPTADLGVRLSAPRGLTRLSRRRGSRATPLDVRPLDFALSHSVHMGVPILGRLTQKTISTATSLVDGPSKIRTAQPVLCGVPMLSISASSYGLMDEPSAIPSTLLADRYQPLLPETLPRSRLIPLAGGRPSPVITAKYRQELFWRDPSTKSHNFGSGEQGLPDTVVEIEADVVHDPSVTARIYNAVPIEGEEEPVHLEVMASTNGSWKRKAPRLGLALHRRITGRTLFLCLDSGTWSAPRGDDGSETCKHFGKFSRIGNKRRQLPWDIPLETAPTAEIGCSFGPGSELMGLGVGQALTRPADRGLKGLDTDLDLISHPADSRGSWTVSAAATSSSTLGAYLRYSKDIGTFYGHAPSMLRLETELAATTSPGLSQQSQHIAVRLLRRFGLWKVGCEAASSPHAVHFSLYVSRVGWRFKLPVLIAGGNTGAVLAKYKLALWAAVVTSFVSAAALQWWRSSNPSSQSLQNQRTRLQNLSKEELQEYISVRRAEADRLVEVLTWATERRQRVERARGGLVILSAKFGVKGSEAGASTWADGEEVADVTAAVAALVDENGRLEIPAGARKSRLLGFWDPAPMWTKVLLVRCLYRGREVVVESRGREELCLPPSEV